MPTTEIPIPCLNAEYVPAVDPENLKTVWSLILDIKELSARHGGTNDLNALDGLNMNTPQELRGFFDKELRPGADRDAVHFRMELLDESAKLGLIEMDHGKPSGAVFKAAAKVPVKVTPNLEYDSLPCEKDEFLRRIEEEKGPKY